ncbi:MAG TPA: FAD-dependent oxidoreductase [Acidimicrobiia bacterium]|nr:FAD-dependent oxidoreductase [Acidimicrobiia bacterium]
MTESIDRVDVAVVGAGLGGLAAAATAARGGVSVAVLDPHPPGGRARSTDRNGFVLNEGAHALYNGGAGAAVLADLGVTYTGGAPRIDKAFTWWDGELVRMPFTPRALLTTKMLSSRSKLAAGRLMGVIGKGAADDAAGLSFDEWLERRRVPDDLRAYVLAVAQLSTYAARPGALAAPAAIRQLSVARQGVLYLDGGWQTLVDGLLAVGRAAGVRVVEESVIGIDRDGGNRGAGPAWALPGVPHAIPGARDRTRSRRRSDRARDPRGAWRCRDRTRGRTLHGIDDGRVGPTAGRSDASPWRRADCRRDLRRGRLDW